MNRYLFMIAWFCLGLMACQDEPVVEVRPETATPMAVVKVTEVVAETAVVFFQVTPIPYTPPPATPTFTPSPTATPWYTLTPTTESASDRRARIFNTLQHANEAYADENWEEARVPYLDLIHNFGIESNGWGRGLRWIGAFRLMLIGLHQDDMKEAQLWQVWLHEEIPEHYVTQAADDFLAEWQNSKDIGIACEVAVLTLRTAEIDPFGSYDIPVASGLIAYVDDVCPHRSQLTLERFTLIDAKLPRLLDWVVEKLQQDVSIDSLHRIFRVSTPKWSGSSMDTIGCGAYSFFFEQEVDLDGDGRSEWLINPYLMCNYAMLPFYIINQDGVLYDSSAEETFWHGSHTLNGFELADLTGDGLPELIVNNAVRGAKCETKYFVIFSGHSGKIQTLMTINRESEYVQTIRGNMIELVDNSDDGLLDIVILDHACGLNSFLVHRSTIFTWSWDGEVMVRSSWEFEPSHRGAYILYDANWYFSQQEFLLAKPIYQRIIEDETLLIPGLKSYGSSSPSLDMKQYAAFRLLMIGALLNRYEEAVIWLDWLSHHYTDSFYHEAAVLFLDEFLISNDVDLACNVVTIFLSSHPDILPVETYYHDAVDPKEMCVFP